MKYNKKIINSFLLICAMFLLLIGGMTYFQLMKAPRLAAVGTNPRTGTAELLTKRGDILDAGDTVLAHSQGSGESQMRVYPFGKLYSHVIGYSALKYGKTGIENTQNGYLLGLSQTIGVLSLAGGTSERTGANVRLTISHPLQKTAQAALDGRNGSVVALDPKTGEILAMYSNPAFDPNQEQLEKNWENLIKDETSPLLPRSTSGMYAPGSGFKIITAAAEIEEGGAEKVWNDQGTVVIDGKEFKNFKEKALGTVNLEQAFAHSSNTVFAEIGVNLGAARLQQTAQRFMIDKPIPFDVVVEQSRMFSGAGKPGKTTVAATAIGQGELMVTPFNMALVAAAIANDGNIMKPYLVSSSDVGNINFYRAKPAVLSKATTPEAARLIGQYMRKAVEYGTGTGANIKGLDIAGKTGTAENEKSGKDHSWFLCFAPAQQPKIALCVMVEYAGTGADAAVPVATRVIREYLRN